MLRDGWTIALDERWPSDAFVPDAGKRSAQAFVRSKSDVREFLSSKGFRFCSTPGPAGSVRSPVTGSAFSQESNYARLVQSVARCPRSFLVPRVETRFPPPFACSPTNAADL